MGSKMNHRTVILVPNISYADKGNVVLSSEQPTYSLSASLANTKSKSTARVLTSAESLALLSEKEKKKKEEEEQNAKRKEE